MRQRIVRTRCGCDQRRAVPFGEILQQSERVGTYPEHRDKAFRWTGCWMAQSGANRSLMKLV
jgi:hypothetical protein